MGRQVKEKITQKVTYTISEIKSTIKSHQIRIIYKLSEHLEVLLLLNNMAHGGTVVGTWWHSG